LHRASLQRFAQRTTPIINTQLDFQPSNYLGGFVGAAADFPVNFFSGGMLARGGEPLTDHTIAAGAASMALPAHKAVAFYHGMSKAALASLILTGYVFDKSVRYFAFDSPRRAGAAP